MIQLKRTDSSNHDFINLVKKLDAYLKIVDGDDHNFYNQYNGLENLKNVVVMYAEDTPVSCGAFKTFDETSVEIKRMFTLEDFRGNGFAENVLLELEAWAQELGFTHCILETGARQVEAINFYNKNGYQLVENYGQYEGIENSRCFKKSL